MTQAEQIIINSSLSKTDKETVLKYIQKLRGESADNGDEIIVESVIAYFNKVTNSRIKGSEAVKKLIRGRIADGFTVDHFRQVIDQKWEDWKEDAFMIKYMRLSTLFAPSHFEEYLNEKRNKFPSEWSKDYQDRLNPQQMQEWWKELRESGMEPIKNKQGRVIEWRKMVGC